MDAPKNAQESLQEISASRIARHSIAFGYRRTGKFVGAGSGVLAKYRSVVGIVTCGHVLADMIANAKKYPDDELFVMPNGPADDQMNWTTLPLYGLDGHSRVIEYDSSTKHNHALGPDIGFLGLDKDLFEKLAVRGSILDLEIQERDIRKNDPPNTRMINILAGHVDSEIENVPFGDSGRTVARFVTALFSGTASKLDDHASLDRYSFKPNGPEDKPYSYKGVSGAGVWALYVRQGPDRVDFVERRLVGIAYYEEHRGDPTRHHIIIHGPRSIYGYLLPKIATLEN
jgi:hypothetical protein